MWRALYRKGKADLTHSPLQSLLLLIVISVGAATLTVAFAVQSATSASFEEVIEEAHGGHVWFFSNEERLREIGLSPDVEQAGDPMPALDAGRLTSTQVPYRLSFFGVGPEIPAVSPALLTDGRWLAPNAPDEAVIDRGMAADAGLELGDTIEVSARGGTAQLTVVGLMVPTSRVPYPLSSYARVFITPEKVAQLGGGEPAYYAAGYRLKDPSDSAQFLQTVMRTYRAEGPPNGRQWLGIRDTIADEYSETFLLMASFSIFALVAAAFIIANSVTGQVQSHLRDVGLLKAIGVTPGQVTLIFVGQVGLVGAVAAAAGVVGGQLLAPVFLLDVSEAVGLAAPVSLSPVAALATVAGITVLTVLAALLPAWRAGRSSTVTAVTGGRTGGERASRLAALASRTRAPRVVVFGVKDLFARSARAWLTIGAVAVASAAVVATVTMDATLTKVLTDPGMIGVLPADLELERAVDGDDRISDQEIVELISANEDVEAYFTRRWGAVSINGVGYAAYAVGGEVEKFEYPLIEGRMFTPRSGARVEAIIGLGLSRHLGLGVGDAKLVHFGGPSGPSRVIEIVGVYIEDSNDGRMITVGLEDVRRAEPEIDAGGYGNYGLKLRPGSDASIVSDSLIERSGGRLVVTDVELELEEAVAELRGVITPILAALSVFLLSLVAVNLFASLMLSVRERSREIGIMKAIGFTPAQVVASIVSGALVLTVIGTVIGAPGGWLFIRVLIHEPFASQGYEPNELIQTPEPIWLGVLLLAAAVVAALGSALPARHAAGTSVSDALRYE